MEVVNKSSDMNEMFNKVKKAFEIFESPKQGDKYEGLAIKVVNGLTDILKKTYPNVPDLEIVNRVCEFIDKINDKNKNGQLWELVLRMAAMS